jgi:NADH:ubiquinone reductase (non-electrogenic)
MSTIGITGIIGSKLMDIYTLFNNNKNIQKKDIIVLGYGWAGKSFCDNIDYNKYNVKVISKTNYMLNTPKLKDSIISTTKKELYKTSNLKDLKFDVDEINNINIDEKKIISNKNIYSYDHLVLAVGSEVNDFNIEGVKENCCFLKTVNDLYNLRKELYKNNKPNNDLEDWKPFKINKKIVIMGGGPVGIELAFQLSKHCNDITILEGLDKILPMYSDDAKEIVKQELNKENIKLILGNQVTKVKPNMIYSIEKIGNETIERKHYYDVAIWNCGIKSNSIIKQLTNERTIQVDQNFMFKENIYAIGDIIASKEMGPPTAQNANQQGKYLANHFNNNFESKSYKFIEKGRLIHSKEHIILDTQLGVLVLPKIVEPIFNFLTDS